MFYQGAVSVTVCRLANRPHVIGRDHGHAVEEIVAIGGVRTRREGPARAIPMLDLRAISVQLLTKRPADCPDVVIGGGGDRGQ